jgi:hypothetical protein
VAAAWQPRVTRTPLCCVSDKDPGPIDEIETWICRIWVIYGREAGWTMYGRDAQA